MLSAGKGTGKTWDNKCGHCDYAAETRLVDIGENYS
jgi:hypothetical protein